MLFKFNTKINSLNNFFFNFNLIIFLIIKYFVKENNNLKF